VLGAVRDLVQIADPDVLQAMQASRSASRLCRLERLRGDGGAAGPLTLAAWALARVLDALTLGESTAQSLGLPWRRCALLVAVVALATGAAVAQTGLIGFVGLVAPHLVRGLARSTHGRWSCCRRWPAACC
jgi:iron complex transport system permease protein